MDKYVLNGKEWEEGEGRKKGIWEWVVRKIREWKEKRVGKGNSNGK